MKTATRHSTTLEAVLLQVDSEFCASKMYRTFKQIKPGSLEFLSISTVRLPFLTAGGYHGGANPNQQQYTHICVYIYIYTYIYLHIMYACNIISMYISVDTHISFAGSVETAQLFGRTCMPTSMFLCDLHKHT